MTSLREPNPQQLNSLTNIGAVTKTMEKLKAKRAGNKADITRALVKLNSDPANNRNTYLIKHFKEKGNYRELGFGDFGLNIHRRHRGRDFTNR